MSLVSANKVETNTYELVVSIGAEDFKKGIDKIYKKTAKNITVPGFRKGKAPKSVIEKLYGEAVFYEDTVNDMYPAAYTKAVEEAGKDGPYLSLDDFRQRTKVSKTVIDLMHELGLFGDLPESNQLSLFDFA